MDRSPMESRRESLSAMLDGELDDEREIALVLTAWRQDAHTRRSWQAYQVIGDVLRSDELAGQGREGLFVERLRERLAHEPVVLAPVAAPRRFSSALRNRLRWRAPIAVGAGFVMVVGALVVTRVPTDAGDAPPASLLAQPATSVTPAPVLAGGSLAASPEFAAAARGGDTLLVGTDQLIRDQRLDAYLAAHKQFGGSSALGVPSGFLRSATYEGRAAPGNR
jgi:sigma-E factor negative regulatory protein RseA